MKRTTGGMLAAMRGELDLSDRIHYLAPAPGSAHADLARAIGRQTYRRMRFEDALNAVGDAVALLPWNWPGTLLYVDRPFKIGTYVDTGIDDRIWRVASSRPGRMRIVPDGLVAPVRPAPLVLSEPT